ncbi:transglutaminase domain-containing protein [[Clostridium] dakarense]|uniref:transglutaminase domain-containing protein n=1 Tax=Faecalimicrobium dakarense TaxID=1301100 RepID=UPI0004BAB153|nr:transglutaminase domain-containing protein [[Clostridium] dakarense]
MNWVSSCWKHDGVNEAGNISSLEILKRASKGESFRCVEYAKVTKDVLLSLGYIARDISIQSEDVDYGGFGKSHVVTEVWSNELRKWIFLDAQLNCYATINNIAVSYYEIFKNFNETSFVFLGDKPKISDKNYRDFIKNYFGYMNVNCVVNGMKYKLYLYLNGTRELMAFQAMQLSNVVFTKKVEDLYFNPNNTTIFFEYKENVDYLKIAKENNLNSLSDLESNIHLFCAKPDFILKFVTNTPNFNHYEVIIDNNESIRLKENLFEWCLDDSINTISIYSVNKQNIKGSRTTIEILYK